MKWLLFFIRYCYCSVCDIEHKDLSRLLFWKSFYIRSACVYRNSLRGLYLGFATENWTVRDSKVSRRSEICYENRHPEFNINQINQCIHKWTIALHWSWLKFLKESAHDNSLQSRVVNLCDAAQWRMPSFEKQQDSNCISYHNNHQVSQ